MSLATDLALGLDPALVARRAGFDPDPWQVSVLRSTAPKMMLNCCRQAGKSTTTAILAVWTAMYQLRSLVLLLSPTLRQSGELFRKCLDTYRALHCPVPAEAETLLRLELVNGSRIISLPGSEGTVRGYSAARLVCVDEASRVDDDMLAALLPMLAISKGRLLALSTPWGKRGWWHKAWTEGGPSWERVTVKAEDCPRLDAAFLRDARQTLGAREYQQEYECSFEDNAFSVFNYDHIRAAFDGSLQPLFDVPAPVSAVDDDLEAIDLEVG